jgi:hypothetical protein
LGFGLGLAFLTASASRSKVSFAEAGALTAAPLVTDAGSATAAAVTTVERAKAAPFSGAVFVTAFAGRPIVATRPVETARTAPLRPTVPIESETAVRPPVRVSVSASSGVSGRCGAR